MSDPRSLRLANSSMKSILGMNCPVVSRMDADSRNQSRTFGLFVAMCLWTTTRLTMNGLAVMGSVRNTFLYLLLECKEDILMPIILAFLVGGGALAYYLLTQKEDLPPDEYARLERKMRKAEAPFAGFMAPKRERLILKPNVHEKYNLPPVASAHEWVPLPEDPRRVEYKIPLS